MLFAIVVALVALGLLVAMVVVPKWLGRRLPASVTAAPPAGLITSVRALSVVVGSAALGGAYRAYLTATPFPPDVVRVVPLLWLAGSVAGWILVVQALRLDTRKLAAIVGLILNVPNTLFAAISSLAALMGD